ncbi:MAG TPA: DinB family protein [Candidatus Krumholzibacteria bacterium]|nr:DinB family protein [Candidatus Krumholzibacteria bacterium]
MPIDRQSFDRLVEQHGLYPSVIASLVRAVDLESMRAREAEGRWSPLEILAHLLDEEREDFRPRAQAASMSRRIDTKIDPVGWVTQRAYNAKDPEQLCREFEHERAESCNWLRALDPELLEASLEHPQLGRMRCGDFVAAWRVHDLLHLRQLSTALTVILARPLSDWRLGYAGQLPPVQPPAS